MTALSDLIHSSKVAPARAIERIAKSDEHQMDRGTVYRYFDGNHPDKPKEKYLLALAYGFELPVTEVRKAASAAPGELGAWTPPLEAGRLTKPVRDALDILIITLAKEGIGRGKPAKKRLDLPGVGETDAVGFDADSADTVTPPTSVEDST